MISVLVGVIAFFGGLYGLFYWRHEFVLVLKGFVPLGLVFAGFIAIVAGLSAYFPSARPKK